VTWIDGADVNTMRFVLACNDGGVDERFEVRLDRDIAHDAIARDCAARGAAGTQKSEQPTRLWGCTRKLACGASG